MKAILLCAGFATRLMPLTRDRAKPLLAVAGLPIVEHLVRQLEASGAITSVTLVSNHRFHRDFKRWRSSVGFDGLRIEVLDNGVEREEERRGAVYDLAWAAQAIGLDEPVLVAAGDNLFRISFEALFDDIVSRDGSVIATYHEPDVERLRRTGVVELAPDGRVTRLVEKPENPPSDIACPALYGLSRVAVSSLKDYVSATAAPDDLGSFVGWLVERQPVYAHMLKGERWDVGDLRSYEAAEAWWAK